VATPAKKRRNLSVVKNDENKRVSSNPTPKRIALTPARRDEILDNIAVEWKETFDLLERFDQGQPLPDLASE